MQNSDFLFPLQSVAIWMYATILSLTDLGKTTKSANGSQCREEGVQLSCARGNASNIR